MNSKIKIILILVMLFIFNKAANSSDILIARDVTQTLQLEISLPATKFLLGEPIIFQAILKNIGTEPIRLPYEYSLAKPFFTYHLDGPKQKDYLFYPVPPAGQAIEYPNEKNSHLLQAGEEETKSFNLVFCDVMVIGHYKINAIYQGHSYEPLNPVFFAGKLTASLEFDVLHPTGEDAAFLESLPKWFDSHEVPKANRCYYHIFGSDMDCSAEIYINHSTSRIASWVLIQEIMSSYILTAKEALKHHEYCGTGGRDYVCDLSSPKGKRELDRSEWKEQRKWANNEIDKILKLYPSAPFSAGLQLQKAINLIALKQESDGLMLLKKFIQECDTNKVISRECNWAKEFFQLWENRKQANIENK